MSANSQPLSKRERLATTILPVLKCIVCNQAGLVLEQGECQLHCPHCHQTYPVHNDIPILTLQPDMAMTFPPSVMVENPLTNQWTSLIEWSAPELVLDFGSGNNPNEHPNLVKMDVFAFPNVDVVGLGERVPFADHSFRAVISGAVFEHVENPFACGQQIHNILKADGEVYIETAFLQPFHAYPNHYFNMTTAGLRKVMSPFAEISAGIHTHQYPSFTLNWILRVWSEKLSGKEKDDFLHASVESILQEYARDVFSTRWMSRFTARDREELACAVYFHGRKVPGLDGVTDGSHDQLDLRAELQRLYQTNSAQQAYIRELEGHLEQVANGRVMRLMNRLKRVLL